MGVHRSGFVAVVGRPNVGKSTLLNHLVGEKVVIVSPRPQTTRNTIRCIYTRPDLQIVFLDTPGLHRPRHRLGAYMERQADSALSEIDAVIFVTEAGRFDSEDAQVRDRLAEVKVPVFAVGSKVDQVAGTEAALRRLQQEVPQAVEALLVSGQTGVGLPHLLGLLQARMPEGPQYYPPEWLTDHPERFVIGELVREQVLLHTEQEVPHAIAVYVDAVEETEQLVRIRATIFVERESQKGIVIGKNGQMLKTVGTAAREQIEALLGTQVYLNLWVKVKKDWRNKAGALREFGYT